MRMLFMESNAFIMSRKKKKEKKKRADIFPTQTQIIETNPFEIFDAPAVRNRKYFQRIIPEQKKCTYYTTTTNKDCERTPN